MAAGPSKPLQHERLVEERISMMDYAATRAPSEGALLPPNRWDLAEATVAMAMVSSPSLTADEVERLYRQLTKIHAINAAQLAECACWRRSDSTPSLV
jgi:hypothetical protein